MCSFAPLFRSSLLGLPGFWLVVPFLPWLPQPSGWLVCCIFYLFVQVYVYFYKILQWGLPLLYFPFKKDAEEMQKQHVYKAKTIQLVYVTHGRTNQRKY